MFAFEFQDRRRMTTILGVHLGIISLAALSFWSYGVIHGVYDTSASGGGDCRRPFAWSVIDYSQQPWGPVNPYVLSRYLARAPFGQGWIISIDNMEDLLAGHYWVGNSN